MRSCLLQLLDYIDASQSHLHSFLRMKGLKIRVGRYLGIADDGSFIIPWDIDLVAKANENID